MQFVSTEPATRFAAQVVVEPGRTIWYHVNAKNITHALTVVKRLAKGKRIVQLMESEPE